MPSDPQSFLFVTSSHNVLGSNPQNEVSFGVYGTPGNVAKDSPVEGKRVIKKVIQDGSPSMPSKVNTSSHPGEADIVMVSYFLFDALCLYSLETSESGFLKVENAAG